MIEYYKNLSLENLFYINDDGLVCEEEWKNVPNYEGLYQASNLGRIKSLSRKIFGGKGYYFSKNKILKQQFCEDRLICTLTKNAIQSKVKIHQLIAIVFLNHTPCGLKKVVDHKNNIPVDNRLDNLQIITQKENSRKDKNPKSGENFIYFEKEKYRLRFVYNGAQTNFGRFSTKKEAVELFKVINEIISKGGDVSEYVKNRTPKTCRNISVHQNKYRVRVNINKKVYRIGEFNDIENAKKALSEFREKHGTNRVAS